MVRIKFDQKKKKPKNLNFGLLKFLRFFLNPKKLGLLEPFSSPAFPLAAKLTSYCILIVYRPRYS